MRKNFGSNPMVYPMPVFVVGTYDKDGNANAMVAAWGGITEEDEITICIDDGHKTAENVVISEAFTVSMADVEHLAACDYIGIVSGNNVPDKLERAGFTAVRSSFVNAPVIEELAMCLECKMISYDADTCRLVGKIVNVSADEKVLDDSGDIDPFRVRPVTYDPVHKKYIALGEIVGEAFGEGLKIK